MEDQFEVQRGIQTRLLSIFPSINLDTGTQSGFARSVDGALLKLKEGEGVDVVILDYRILRTEDNEEMADDATLAALPSKINHLFSSKRSALIRVTAFLDELAQVRSAEMAAIGYVIRKDPHSWMDIVAAYIFRTLVLDKTDQFRQMFHQFNFDLLHGWLPSSRIRGVGLRGMDEFNAFRAELEMWWPIFAGWPEDRVETKEQIEPLIQEIRRHFEIDDSKVDLELGTGEVRMKLLYRPDSAPRTSPLSNVEADA